MRLEGSAPGRLVLTPESDDERELLKETLDMARGGDRRALLYWGDAEAKGEDGKVRGWTAFIINAHQAPSPDQKAPPTVEQAEVADATSGAPT